MTNDEIRIRRLQNREARFFEQEKAEETEIEMVSLLSLLPPVQFLMNLLAWYNFVRKYETLKGRTLAMAGGLTSKAWTIKQSIGRAAD
jgi:hypothetical protein